MLQKHTDHLRPPQERRSLQCRAELAALHIDIGAFAKEQSQHVEAAAAHGGLHDAAVLAALHLDRGAAVEHFLHERGPVADDGFLQGGAGAGVDVDVGRVEEEGGDGGVVHAGRTEQGVGFEFVFGADVGVVVEEEFDDLRVPVRRLRGRLLLSRPRLGYRGRCLELGELWLKFRDHLGLRREAVFGSRGQGHIYLRCFPREGSPVQRSLHGKHLK